MYGAALIRYISRRDLCRYSGNCMVCNKTFRLLRECYSTPNCSAKPVLPIPQFKCTGV